MKYSNLGHTGLKVRQIGLGTMNFGMETSEAHSLAMLDAAPAGGSGAKLRTNYGPRRPNSAHLNGQRWTPAISGSRSTTVEARSGGQGVASSNLASPTK